MLYFTAQIPARKQGSDPIYSSQPSIRETNNRTPAKVLIESRTSSTHTCQKCQVQWNFFHTVVAKFFKNCSNARKTCFGSNGGIFCCLSQLWRELRRMFREILSSALSSPKTARFEAEINFSVLELKAGHSSVLYYKTFIEE